MARRWLASFILVAGLVLATAATPAAGIEPDHEIRLLSRRFTPPAGVPETARQAIGRRAEELRARGKERLHLLVQLHELPSPASRQEFARQGLDLGAYVPGSAFIAAVPVGHAVAAVARPEVRWATLWEAGHKLHPRVAAGDWAPWTRDPARPERIAVMLLLHHDVPLEAGPELAAKVGGVAMPAIEGLHGMTVWLPQTRVAELADEEEVLWIEEAPPPLTPTNDGVRSGLRATGLADPPYGLTGSGVRLFVFDEGTVRRTHQTFDPGTGSRVALIDGTPMSRHATHVAGTAAGDGSGSAGDRGRGVAPGVSLLSAGYEQVQGTMLFWDNAGDLEADYARARTVHQADLGTNSIGSNTAQNDYPCEREGDYGVSSSLIDNIVHGTNAAVGSPVFMTWAAGNERNAGDIPGRCGSNYGTTAPPSCAKNPLHVGAVNSDGLSMTEFSSWGPCDDGRLKPTLVAPGCETGLVTGETGVFSSTADSDSAYGSACGTSKATPAVAGVASLLTQAWREQGFGGPTGRPLPALIKALLIHTARDLGPEGPDYVYGYGAVDAKAAVDLVRESDFFTRGWFTGTVGPGEVIEHYIDGPWMDLEEAKMTLVWDDPAAAPFAAGALVNDLTLEYSNFPNSSTLYQPWVLAPASPHLPATTGVDSRNNVEQIVVRDLPASETMMRVIGTRVPSGPQSYALVYSFNPLVVDYTACTVTSSTFETGTDGWTLSGAARTLAPASGHGAESVRLGGAVDLFHQATRAVAVPSEGRTELAFWWYMTTEESLDLFGFGFDPFTAEIRNSSGDVLAVADLRNDGWPQGRWMRQRIDLTPWAGQTVTIAFTATNDFEAATTFWIDDVTATSCPLSIPATAVDDTARVNEDSGATTIDVLANDTNPDGGRIEITWATWSQNGTVVITNGGAALTYAPNPNYCNTPPGTKLDTFTYTLTPGGSTATVTVTVNCVDDPPATQAQTLDQTLSGCNGVAPLRTIQATPSNYRSLIAGLLPGDRLQLAAGTYTQGLPLHNKHGEPGKCIVIEGPASGSPALFTGLDNGNNLVSLKDSSYIALRNLTLDGLGRAGDGIKAEAGAVSVHHILIEGLSLKNFNQSGVSGINTKCPAWNWVVRHTTITSTFTGMNLGDSSGQFELANLLIEHNLVHGTQSYNAVFWDQLSRNTSIGVPSTATTIIRHNTFGKETGSLSGSQAQPNLLVGHWPLSGPGSSDIYQIYGNLFYQNPYESLFQGEGNLAFHDNLLVNRTSEGVRIQPRSSVPRRIEVFNNTVVVGSGNGILITGADPAYPQRVVGNAVFAPTPLTGGQQSSNVTGTYAAASTYINNPMAALGSGLDLYPKTGQLQGTAIDHSVFSGLLGWDRDFNNRSRIATYRGAYSGDGVNPGWTPALAIKPSTGNELQNGVPVSGLSGATGSQQFWTMSVPSGASNLQFQTSGGTGDVDMYVRFGSAPTTTTYACRPYEGDNDETCSFPTPAAGTWHVMLDGYAAYSGVTLVGSYEGCKSISDVEPNDSRAAPQAISGSCNQISGTFLNDATTQQNDYFRLSLPAGRTVTALLNGLTVDYDLYIYNAAGTEVASSEAGGTTADQASWTNTGSSAVNVYILVWRFSSTRTTYQLRVSD